MTPLLFNLTGGTKPMMLAAYTLAVETHSPFIYLQSEAHRSMLDYYAFEGSSPVRSSWEELPELISLDDYLRAHLPKYTYDNSINTSSGSIPKGKMFEHAVYQP